jgi:hypothetical protein
MDGNDLLSLYNDVVHEPRAAVYCYTCGNHIYNIGKVAFGGTTLSSSLFEPASDDIPAPVSGSAAKCPLCGGSFVGPDCTLLINRLPEVSDDSGDRK